LVRENEEDDAKKGEMLERKEGRKRGRRRGGKRRSGREDKVLLELKEEEEKEGKQ